MHPQVIAIPHQRDRLTGFQVHLQVGGGACGGLSCQGYGGLSDFPGPGLPPLQVGGRGAGFLVHRGFEWRATPICGLGGAPFFSSISHLPTSLDRG